MYKSLKDRYKPERQWPGNRSNPFPLEGGHVVLQFINTCINKGGENITEYLQSYNDFLDWCVELKLIDESEYTDYELNAYCYQTEANLVWQRAVKLRWAAYEIVKCSMRDQPIHENDVNLLNEYVNEANAHLHFELIENRLQLAWFNTFEELALPLWMLTKHVQLLVQSVNFKNIKRCACGKFYLDSTKNNNRRWCNPLVCGSITRMRKYRGQRTSSEI